jgi:hypothetical protein
MQMNRMQVSFEELAKAVQRDLQRDHLEQTAQAFSTWKRATASPDAEAAADYLCSHLKDYGIPYERMRFQGYFSTAVSAKLEIFSPEAKEFEVVPCGYTKNVKNLDGELCYDRWSEQESRTNNEQRERFASFSGKIVLTRDFCSDIAYEAAEAGALAVIGMYVSPEDVPHYFGASNHNGTPTPENRHLLPRIPCIDCTKAAGDYMLQRLREGPVRVRLSAEAETCVKEASIPVAYIPGTEENFVLIDGHYDSHGVGMTDNGAGDAILLELARVFYAHREKLKRGLLFCWWSGHEFGQYAGSTWYIDTHYEQIKKHCVAQVNIDIAGSKGAECIRARTTQMEGRDFTAGRIERYTGYPARPYIPRPHLGEPNFLGKEVPISIMLKYEARPEMQKIWPVGGGYWWHSREDTIDKVDFDNAMRDAKINVEMICEIANSKQIPVDMPCFLQESRRMLEEIGARLHPDFDLAPLFPQVERLEKKVAGLCCELERRENTDAIIKKVAGGLIRMVYTYTAAHDYDRLSMPATFPKFRVAIDVTPENTDKATYLFLKTDFLRQRNRLMDEIEYICDEIELDQLRWNATGTRGEIEC